MRFPTRESKGRPFWKDVDGFTTRDFKVVVTSLTWLSATAWMVWLLMGGDGGASELHLRFYTNISQVFMVLLGGMAMTQFGSMWAGGGGYYGGGMNDMAGGYGGSSLGEQSPDHQADTGGTPQ